MSPLDPAASSASAKRLLVRRSCELERLASLPAHKTQTHETEFVRVPSSGAAAAACRAMYNMRGSPVARLVKVDHGGMWVRRDALDVLLLSQPPPSTTTKQRKNQQRGGAELGTGREGTVVYTSDDLLLMYPEMERVCVWEYGDVIPECGDTRSSPIVTGEEMVAVKDLHDNGAAIAESTLHEMVHGWFREDGKLHLSPLHPTHNCADIVWGDGRRRHRVLFFRAMAGDTAMLRLGPRDMVELAVSVLQALAVFHARDHLHLDVKPHNILYAFKGDTGDEKSSSSSHKKAKGKKAKGNNDSSFSGGDRYDFVLADYGLMATSKETVRNMYAGGSPSGTDGYLSPLLLSADGAAEPAIPPFERVAGAVRLKQPLGWGTFFAKRRAMLTEASGVKADLHSLALTLLKLLRSSKAAAGEGSELLSNPVPPTGDRWEPMVRFIARLMFFRKTDLHTAATALAAARALLSL